MSSRIKKVDRIANVDSEYFSDTIAIIEQTLEHLKHMREFTPNPTLLDRRISVLQQLRTEFSELSGAIVIKVNKQ